MSDRPPLAPRHHDKYEKKDNTFDNIIKTLSLNEHAASVAWDEFNKVSLALLLSLSLLYI